MATAGPLDPGTAADDPSVGSATAWSTPEAIQTGGDSWSGNLSSGVNSHYLKGSDYGFAVPAGSTILGITVALHRTGTSPFVFTGSVRVAKGGTYTSSNPSASNSWTGGPNPETYGGASDLWGTTWSVSDVNDAGFGAAVQAVYLPGFGGNGYGTVQGLKITVTYTPPAGATLGLGLTGSVQATSAPALALGGRVAARATATLGLGGDVVQGPLAVSLGLAGRVRATATRSLGLNGDVSVYVPTATLTLTGRVQETNTRALVMTGRVKATTAYQLLIDGEPDVVAHWPLDEPSGGIAYDSVGGHDGAYSGSYTQGVAGLPGAPAVAFTAGRVAVPYSTALTPFGAFSLECWVQTTQDYGGVLFSKWVADEAPYAGYGLAVGNVGLGVVGVACFWAGAGSWRAGTRAINDGRRHHLVLTRSGTAFVLYVDGTVDQTFTVTAALVNTVGLSLGRDEGSASGFYEGVLDEPAYYDAALSAEQVAAHWAAGATRTVSLGLGGIVVPTLGMGLGGRVRDTFAVTEALSGRVSDVSQPAAFLGLGGTISGTTVLSLTLEGTVFFAGAVRTKSLPLIGRVRTRSAPTMTLSGALVGRPRLTFTTDGAVLATTRRALALHAYVFDTVETELQLDGLVRGPAPLGTPVSGRINALGWTVQERLRSAS